MKPPHKYPKDLHPMTAAELAELWRRAPSPEMRAALWEIRRLKVFISQVQACCKEIDYLYFPSRPEPMSGLRRELAIKIAEKWRQEKPTQPSEKRAAEAREQMIKNMAAAFPQRGEPIKIQKLVLPEDDRKRPA